MVHNKESCKVKANVPSKPAVMPKEGGKLNESEVGKQAMIIGNGEGKKSQLEWVIK